MSTRNGPLTHADLPDDAVHPAAALTSGQWFRPIALAVLTALLFGLCVLLTVPFLPAVTWAVALAIVAWPLHAWINRHVPWPGLAAALSTMAVVLLVLMPGLFVTYQLAREAGTAAEYLRDEPAGQTLRTTMVQAPILRELAAWMDRVDVDLEREVRKIVASYTQDASGLIQGSLTASIQFAVAVFLLFHLFRDRGYWLRTIRDLLPLTRAESDRVFTRAADSVYANLYATLVTSLIDGVSGGLMFWLLGLPSPMLWGVVMFVLSILPVVGTAIIWVPAAVFLALTGRWLGAATLVGWGIVEWFIVDNIIYVRLAGDRMRIHQAPALVAFLGGLAVFGTSGMILGPAILAVTVAMLEVWKKRVDGAKEIISSAEPVIVGDERAQPS